MWRRQDAVEGRVNEVRRCGGLIWLVVWAAAASAAAQKRPDILWMQGGHAFAVHGVAVSPTGDLFASAGADGTVKLWRAANGALQQTLTGHTSDVNSVAFSPNGRLLASADAEGFIRVWQVQDGRLANTFTHGELILVLSVAFSPDGSLLASAGMDGMVKLWRVATGALERTIPAHDQWVASVAFSPDGQLLASASAADGTIKLWRVSNGTLVNTLTGHTAGVTSVAFAPRGGLLASAGEDGTVRLWRVSDGQLEHTLSYSDAAPAFSVAFSSDGSQLAAGGMANYIRVWRVSNRTLLRTLTGHAAPVVSVAFVPDSPLLVSGGADSAIKLWRVEDGALLRTLTGHTLQVTSVAFAPNRNLLASGSGDSTVKMWRAADGGLERTLTGHESGVTSVAFSPDGQLLASASEGGTVKLWRTVDGGLFRTFTAHASAVASVAFSPNGQLLATASEDGTVKLWRVANGVLQQTISAHAGYVASVAFSPDGSLLASGGEDSAIRVWRVADGGLERTLTGHTAPVACVAFSPNGSLIASGSADASIKLWNVSNATLIATLEGHSDSVYAIAFSPDGSLLASGGADRVINLWRVSDGTRLQSYSSETGTGVLAIQFSPDGRWFGYGRLDATVVAARNPFPPNRPPAVPELLAPADNATVSPTPTLRVRLSDPDNDQVQAEIEIYSGTNKVRTLQTDFVASGAEASTVVNPPLEAGNYTWRARARDSAGNESEWSSTRAFTVEAPPPSNRPPAVPELLAPADNATVPPTPTLRVRLSDPDNDQVQAEIEIYSGTNKVRTLQTDFVASGAEASPAVNPPLEAGNYTWRARARDSAGNESEWSSTRAFTVEAPPPSNRPPAVPELLAPADGATVSPTLTLRVRLSDPDNDQVQAEIEIYSGTNKVRTLRTDFVASGAEASTVVNPPLEAGNYTWRARARDSAGNESEWSAPRRITVSASVPTRLAGIRTFALSLRTPTSDPNALGLNGVSIMRWDAATQQYAPATELRLGEAYFIKATNPVQPNLFGEPVTGEVVIPLKPGWNLIANPTLAPIAWQLDGVQVQRGSERRSLREAQRAGWVEDYLWAWQQNPNDPQRGQYQLVYDATELRGAAGALEPWQAYWMLARVECALVLNAQRTRAAAFRPAPATADWTLQIEAVSASGDAQAVWIGVAGGRSVRAVLAPAPPENAMRMQARLRCPEGAFAADIRPTLGRDAHWSLEVAVAPSSQPQPITLRVAHATHLPRGVNLMLVDEQSRARRPLRAAASLSFVAPAEGGVFRFRIEPMSHRALLRVLNPTVRGASRAGDALTLSFNLTAEAQVQVQIRTGSRAVRTLSDARTRSAGLHEFVWDGRDDAGVHLPPGAYIAEITAVSADGQIARAVTPIVLRR
jgi:WD40 repeat protein